MRKTDALGYYGNIWIRQNLLEKAGEFYHGHTHDFDHVSLLSSGEVCVEIKGRPPKTFKAPTFIVIKRDLEHKFTAVSDNVVWFCIHALRDLDGEVIEDLYSMENDPSEYFWSEHSSVSDVERLVKPRTNESAEDYEKRKNDLDKRTTYVSQKANEWNNRREARLRKNET